MATHSNSPACRIPWTELLPGGLQSIGSQRVGHGSVAEDAHTNKDRISKQNNGSEEITKNAAQKPGDRKYAKEVMRRGRQRIRRSNVYLMSLKMNHWTQERLYLKVQCLRIFPECLKNPEIQEVHFKKKDSRVHTSKKCLSPCIVAHFKEKVVHLRSAFTKRPGSGSGLSTNLPEKFIIIKVFLSYTM